MGNTSYTPVLQGDGFTAITGGRFHRVKTGGWQLRFFCRQKSTGDAGKKGLTSLTSLAKG